MVTYFHGSSRDAVIGNAADNEPTSQARPHRNEYQNLGIPVIVVPLPEGADRYIVPDHAFYTLRGTELRYIDAIEHPNVGRIGNHALLGGEARNSDPDTFGRSLSDYFRKPFKVFFLIILELAEGVLLFPAVFPEDLDKGSTDVNTFEHFRASPFS